MKLKYSILTIFVIFTLSLNAQQEILDKQFYYYKGERFYLQTDYSRVSVVSEGKFFMENIRELSDTDCRIINEAISYTRQNVMPFDESTEMRQNKEIIITEMGFSENLNQTDYDDFIQRLSVLDNVIKVSPTYTIFNEKLGISNNLGV
jgi:hypothetical protein